MSRTSAAASPGELAGPSLPPLGVGIVYSSAVEPLLDRYPDLFDVLEIDPLPMLRTLAEDRLTDIPGQPCRFEVEITPDGPLRVSGLTRGAVQQTFPFH